MKKAIFVSKVKNLKIYKLTLAVQMFPITPAKYNVIKDIKISEEEYQKLTSNFYEGWDWLPETAHENGVLNCVRINISSTLSHIDLTWRLELPVAITMKSVMLRFSRGRRWSGCPDPSDLQGGDHHLDQLFGLHSHVFTLVSKGTPEIV